MTELGPEGVAGLLPNFALDSLMELDGGDVEGQLVEGVSCGSRRSG